MKVYGYYHISPGYVIDNLEIYFFVQFHVVVDIKSAPSL